MRKSTIYLLMVLFLALVALASTASAQDKPTGWIELEGVVAEEVTPSINVYAVGPIKGMVGWTLYMQAGQNWSEGLVGLTLAPLPWLSVSGSVGIETHEDSPLRGGMSVWAGKGKWSILSIQENGGSGRWQKSVGLYQATPTIGLGVLHQEFIGVGPYIIKKFGPLSLWGAYAPLDDRGLVTAHFDF